MNLTALAWFESIFNVLYLVVVWGLVVQMTRQMASVAPQNRKTAGLIRLAFLLLAAGDTGHVGFRVLAYLLGGLNTQVQFMGQPASLVGLGMMTTAYTVTLFYMVLVYVWQARYRQAANWISSGLLAAGVLRLMMMALPGNDWGAVVPPQPMSILRNLPLLVQGAGITGLIFYSAYRKTDVRFQQIGWMIVASFAFYIPVILFAQQIPLLGMLMIPKTCAYLAVAWIAYRALWTRDLTQARGVQRLGEEGETQVS